MMGTKTSQCWGHKEYVYQVLLTYDDGNIEKNRETVSGGGGPGAAAERVLDPKIAIFKVPPFLN